MPKLYLISPPKFELEEFATRLNACLATGKVDLFQLRMKDVAESEIENAAGKLIPICRANNVPFILNDSAALAKKLGTDGVHLGEESGEYSNARALLGDGAHIGISCYADYDRAAEFATKGADLVSFGQFYPTKTKPPKGWADIELLQEWKANQTTPCTAIGGLTPERAKPLTDAGADFICVVSYVWDAEDAAQAVLDFDLA